jgi:hypothetical protein
VLTAAAAGGQVVILPVATIALVISLQASLGFLGILLVASALLVALVVPRRQAGDVERHTKARIASIAREREFWLLVVPFFVCGYTSTGLTDTHLIPYAIDHHIEGPRLPPR